MDGQIENKLNHLLKTWKRGTVAVQPWLDTLGIYRQLAERYRKYKWLERIGRGAFIRSGDKVNWSGGLYAIQSQLHLPVHAAGKTALQLSGLAHFLSFSENESIFLFGTSITTLPAWFRKYDWGRTCRYCRTSLFQDSELGLYGKEVYSSYTINISSPERAIMEVLYLVPKVLSFKEAEQLMAGLTTLRPGLVQSLLEKCNSIKVKRLFMYLAEKCMHQWVRKLEMEKINFGSGKRVIAPDGKLDKKYQITVPRDDSTGLEMPQI